MQDQDAIIYAMSSAWASLKLGVIADPLYSEFGKGKLI